MARVCESFVRLLFNKPPRLGMEKGVWSGGYEREDKSKDMTISSPGLEKREREMSFWLVGNKEKRLGWPVSGPGRHGRQKMSG